MHNLRCEHSNSKSTRCRCTCGGQQHGIQTVAERRHLLTGMRQVIDDALARTERAGQAQRERELLEGTWA